MFDMPSIFLVLFYSFIIGSEVFNFSKLSSLQHMQITVWLSSISFRAYADITFQSSSDVSIYTSL